MYIHKEGYKFLLLMLLLIGIINVLVYAFLPKTVFVFLLILSIGLYIFLLSFFRNPNRAISHFDNQKVYAPADGKVVAIEETLEEEYFKEKKLQISIFMSPLNVHVNRNPIGGVIKYYKYHKGNFLPAWNPKSSLENERTTIVINNGTSSILIRQIAGALAKRIVNYLSEGQLVKQGEDMGFIKLGSRVDIFLPLSAQVNVTLNEKVKGNKTVIAELD